MKGLCTEISPRGAVFAINGDQPVVGSYYLLEDLTSGTGAQNRAFHALLDAFYSWMSKTDQFVFENSGAIYDLATPSQGDFREYFKYKYGEGFSHLEYVGDDMGMYRVDTWEEIPLSVIEDFRDGNKKRIKGVLKSWSDYTKAQRRKAIDNLFMLIGISQCNDRRVAEIMDGMLDSTEKIKQVFNGEVINGV